MEDAVLLQQINAGDKAAFRKLISLYGDKVINTCYRFLLNRQDAEDMAQEVFIEIYKSANAFRGTSKLSTWIYRITVSKCLDEIKKRNRKKRLIAVGKILGLEEVANWIAGGTIPDKELEEKEQMNEMMQALNGLPDNQRIAFTLSKIEGYSNAEIAEIMGTSQMAVESLVYRAKKKIGQILKDILNK